MLHGCRQLYIDIAKDVGASFDISVYELDRPSKGITKT